MDVEQRAREMLAAEYAKGQFRAYAPEIRNGTTVAFDEEIRAIVAIITSLTPPEGYVLVPVERGAMYVCPTCHGVGSVTQQVHDQMLAARPEVKA